MWLVRQWTPCVPPVVLWLWSFQIFHDLCGSRLVIAQEFFLTESLRHISNVRYVGWTFLRRMIREWYPGACCTEDPEKKLSQSPIGTSGVFRRWIADLFSKSNIHFLEVVSIKSTCEFKHIIEWVLLETVYKSVHSSGPDASHLRDFSGR